MSQLLVNNLFLVLGIIIGLLLNPGKQKIEKIVRIIKDKYNPGKAQFLDPITDKEKFNNAKNIGDMLND